MTDATKQKGVGSTDTDIFSHSSTYLDKELKYEYLESILSIFFLANFDACLDIPVYNKYKLLDKLLYFSLFILIFLTSISPFLLKIILLSPPTDTAT